MLPPQISPGEEPSREKCHQALIVLGNEVFTLHMYRTFWRDFIRAAETAKVTPGHIFDFFAATYSTRQAVAIRRLCSPGRREFSFHHLLSELRDNPDLTTYPTDPADVEVDLQTLNAGNLRGVRNYVNQYVAHRDLNRVAAIPTFADIHSAIDELGRLLQKYMRLVEDVDQELDPIVGGDVMGPFRKAWLPELPS